MTMMPMARSSAAAGETVDEAVDEAAGAAAGAVPGDPPERDSKQRFSERVDAYQRARPDYPDAVAHLVLQGLGLPANAHVADVGCGTGLSSRPFLHAGCRVVGVEPNDAMRAAAARSVAHSVAQSVAAESGFAARFSVVAGSAEATTLPSSSVDIVCAGQAFHWFDPAGFAREARRLLRADGGIVLFWNARQHAASAFMTEFNALLLEHCAEYRAKWKGDDVGAKHAPAMRIVFGQPWQEASLAHAQTLDCAGLLARVDSDSYAPPASDPAHAPLQDALQKLHAHHAHEGKITIVHQTRIFFGRPA